MKISSLPLIFLGFCAVTLTGLVPAISQEGEAAKAPARDAYAQSIMKSAADFLGGSKGVAFRADIWEDVAIEDGPVLQSTRRVDVSLTRPDRLRAEIHTADIARTFFYNGKSLTIHDAGSGCYGSIGTPGTLDETLDAASEKGIEFPLEDVLRSKPFGEGAAKAESSQYLGVEEVLGKRCHHLAFQNESVDWQAWVEAGPRPLLRKAVLHFKDEAAKPSLTAIFSHWEMEGSTPASAYEFTPPPGSAKIEVVAVPAVESPETEKAEPAAK